MRVVGGELGGRALQAPRGRDIRPTSDRLRGALFDILAHAYGRPRDGERVVDLFAGTGALAIEALSRGAGEAILVDAGREAQALIAANLESLGLSGRARLIRRDARKLGPAPKDFACGLAFLDPPYGRGLAAPALSAFAAGGWLAPDALIVVEEGGRSDLILPQGLAALETRRFGDTQVVFAQPAR